MWLGWINGALSEDFRGRNLIPTSLSFINEELYQKSFHLLSRYKKGLNINVYRFSVTE